MTTTADRLWQTKLHTRLHDPAERALALLRDPAGHEGGTSGWLHSLIFQDGIPDDLAKIVQQADGWASAADRPQWPAGDTDQGTPNWAHVQWMKRPILIHPLTGRQLDLSWQHGADIEDLKQRSHDHFKGLIQQSDGEINWRKTAFAFWRFGPELVGNGSLERLWPHLPGDARVPDHSIWDHLDLTSAFAGAFAADPAGEAALLALSIGPVQSFIAAARTTSDLWAGSHLLARLSWEAARVICERLGPDAIVFPRLRGLPQVDVWLQRDCELPADLFARCGWRKSNTDSNPLFAAALPNRFVAVVPASEAKQLAKDVENRVRQWLLSLGENVVERLLKEVGDPVAPSSPAYAQLRDQLEEFPEVHWAAVPFSLIRGGDAPRQSELDTSQLSAAMAPFFGVEASAPAGFLDTAAWKALKNDISLPDGTTFLAPNPGVLYPAVYDLSERVLAAAKAVRPFVQTRQEGWRCSLTGETEWLTTDRAQLANSYRQRSDTLWAKVASKHPAWAKKGEHLGAVAAIKRLWPTEFAEEVGKATGDDEAAQRFVVSTHTMALAHQLRSWLAHGAHLPPELESRLRKHHTVALPRGLARLAQKCDAAKLLPGLLDEVRDGDDEADRNKVERLVRQAFAGGTSNDVQVENYYALLLFDGDHMGRILSGDPNHAITYLKSFHPDLRDGFNERAANNPPLREYGDQKRAMSPNRHLAISAALNEFALHVVPHVVESEHLGRVIYAGGDDVLAMLPACDLLSAMQRLRVAYSGDAPEDQDADWQRPGQSHDIVAKDGFVKMPDGRLLRMMGGATASGGAVVVHYQTPLATALTALRAAEQRAKNEGGRNAPDPDEEAIGLAAEQRAKNEGGRNAFSLSVLKRSGGTLHLTAEWQLAGLLTRLRDFLAEPAVSRRAVYNSVAWLEDLPNAADEEMLGALFAYQLRRQTRCPRVAKDHDLPRLAKDLVAAADGRKDWKPWLRDTLSVAEFLSREARQPNQQDTSGDSTP